MRSLGIIQKEVQIYCKSLYLFLVVNLHENNAGGCGGIWFRYRYAITAPIIGSN